jgi:DNA-binding CsgD family transcriptional regulator
MTARQDASARLGDPLTVRELQCIAAAARGLTNAEIRAELGLSRGTVFAAFHRAYAKLGARTDVPQVTRAHAVHLARHLITAKERTR